MKAVLAGVVLVSTACQGSESEAPPPGPATIPAPPTAPADTLVRQTSDGYQVWFAEGREARDSGGATCYERSVEIRRGAAVMKVPLLFTTRAPTQLDRRSVRAELMRDCRVVGIYRVELATGRPTRIGR